MSRRFGTVPFISGMFVMSCATIPGIEFIIWKLRFVRVCELQMKWKINIEAARLACPKSKDEAHFFPLPLFVPGHRRVSTQNMPAARPRWMLIFTSFEVFARACKKQLSIPEIWRNSYEHSTDEGHSAETSGHLLRFWHFHKHSSLLFIVVTSATQPRNAVSSGERESRGLIFKLLFQIDRWAPDSVTTSFDNDKRNKWL